MASLLETTINGTLAVTGAVTFDMPATLPNHPMRKAEVEAGFVSSEALDGYQPLDSDLTAIAALATTSYGRAFLVLADAAAARSALGASTIGATLLTAADAAAIRTALALVAGTDVEAHDPTLTGLAGKSTTGTGSIVLAGSPGLTGTPTAPTPGSGNNTTQLATTAYVRGEIATALTSVMVIEGALDCSANPNYPAGTAGFVWRVSVAGKIGGASGVVVSVGDMIVCYVTNAGGTQAAVGTSWGVEEGNLPGITTVGNNLLVLANPGAVTFLRINADNSVTARTAVQMLSDIGAQAASTNLTTFAGIAPSANVQTLLGASTFAAFKSSLSLDQVANTSDATKNSATATLTNKTLGSGTVVAAATMTMGSDATGDIYYRASGGALTRLAAGTNGYVLTLTAGLPAWAAASGGSTFAGGLVTSDVQRAASSGADGLTLKVDGIYRTGSTANLPLILGAKNNGSIQADTGGDARGARALDFQWTRTSSTQVASGNYSVILGGFYNTASGANSAVGGGEQNTASGTWSWAEGYHNECSGINSHVEGALNLASGVSAHAEGQGTTASGDWSHAEGMGCEATGVSSHAQGMCAVATKHGQHAEAAGEFIEDGDAQVTRLVWRGVTGDDTEAALGFGGGPAVLFATEDGKSYFITVEFCARAIDAAGGHARHVRQIVLSNTGGVTADASGVQTIGTDISTLAIGGVDIAIDGSYIQLRVTGIAATNIAWVARMEAVEIKYVSIAPAMVTGMTIQDNGPSGSIGAPRADSDTLAISTYPTFSGVPAPTIAYEWWRSSDGSSYTTTGAYGPTYAPTSLDDVGCFLLCIATATNGSGSATATSSATGAVVNE